MRKECEIRKWDKKVRKESEKKSEKRQWEKKKRKESEKRKCEK